MLHRGPLHEQAHVPDDEREIQPGMDLVVQAPDQSLVVCGVDLLRRAVLTKLEPLLHWGVG